MFIIYYLTYLFLFRIVLSEKCKSIKAVEDDFYHKIIEAKYTEEVDRRCSTKKFFLEISQNSQENTCAGLSFLIKLQAEAEACNFIKKENLAQMFTCEICEISKNTFFYWTPPVAVS